KSQARFIHRRRLRRASKGKGPRRHRKLSRGVSLRERPEPRSGLPLPGRRGPKVVASGLAGKSGGNLNAPMARRSTPLAVSVPLSGSKRQEVFNSFNRLAQPFEKLLEVLVPVDEIDLGRFDHQQVRTAIMKEKMFVSVDNRLQVLIGYLVLEGNILLLDPPSKRLRLRLKVYH